MSRHDYRSSSGFAEQGYSDHVPNPAPIISHNVARGTCTYVTKVETHIQEMRRPKTKVYSYTTPVKVDLSKGARPKEVDSLITQILDEVNGPPISTIRPSSGPLWDHHSPPAKVDYSVEYEADYRLGASSPTKAKPRRDYHADYLQGGSPVRSQLPREYGDPYNQKDRSRVHVNDQIPPKDYGVRDKMWNPSYKTPEMSRDRLPKNGHSMMPETSKDYRIPNNSIKPETLTDHEVYKPQWERSPYSIYEPSAHSPFPIRSETFKDYGSPKTQWGNTFLKPESVRYVGVSSPRNPQSEGLSRPVLDHSIENQSPRKSERTKDHIVSGSPVGSSPVKPQSPKGYGDADKSRNKSSNIYDDPVYSSPRSNGGVDGVSNDLWGNSLPKTQSLHDYGVPGKEQGRSSARVYNSPLSNGGIGGFSNEQVDNSPRKTQNLHDYGCPDKDYGRFSAPVYSSPRANVGGAPNDQLGNPQAKTQIYQDHEHPDNQQGKSLGPFYEVPSPKGRVGGIGNERWSNTHVKTQNFQDHGGPNNNKQGTSSRPVYGTSLPNGNIGGLPNDQWGNPSVKTQNYQDLGAPDNPRGKSSGPIYESPSPKGKTQNLQDHEDPNNNKQGKSPRLVYGTSMPNGNIGGVPKDQQAYPSAKTDNNQLGRSSGPIYEPPSLSGIANDKLSNSPVKSQNRDHGGPKPQQGRSSGSVYGNPIPFSSIGGVPNEQRANPQAKTKSYQDLGGPDNEHGRSLGSNYEPPSPKGVANDQWTNSPVKSQNLQDHRGPDNQGGKVSTKNYESPSPKRNTGVVPDDRWGSTPVKTHNVPDHGGPNSKQVMPSSSTYDPPPPNSINGQHKQPDLTNKDGKPSLSDKPHVMQGTYPENSYKPYENYQTKDSGNNKELKKPSSYSPIGDDMGRVAAGASPGAAGRSSSELKFSVPPPQQPKQKSIVNTPAINSREAQRLYGGLNFPSGQYTDEDYKPVITSEQALARYKGTFVPF